MMTRPNLREYFIRTGVIRPADTDAPTPAPKPVDEHRAVLRIDDVGREAAKRAIARPTRQTAFFSSDFFDLLRARARGERGR